MQSGMLVPINVSHSTVALKSKMRGLRPMRCRVLLLPRSWCKIALARLMEIITSTDVLSPTPTSFPRHHHRLPRSLLTVVCTVFLSFVAVLKVILRMILYLPLSLVYSTTQRAICVISVLSLSLGPPLLLRDLGRHTTIES